MGKAYKFKALLAKDGWIENAVVTLNSNGIIQSLSSNQDVECDYIDGYALPGFQNAHSHAFQYAMAGLAELYEGNGVPDDFWSWRTSMYNLALTVSPEHLENIAAMVYAEMVRHGYTAVAEFHYLHHDINGQPYDNLAEHGERLISAAQRAGINITLVPMFYQKGGFGKPPEKKQKRFISRNIESYYKLLESSKKATEHYEKSSIGIGIHSLRAVQGNDIISLTNGLQADLPFHIHVAEQLKEIEDCIAHYGKRPVTWLFENCNVTEDFHLVHATHLNDYELHAIAKANAHVVLCPSTEGNLGDGLFRFEDYKNKNGNWSIGTDSHVGLNPFEELRILDYGQRLTSHKRNTFYHNNKGDCGFNAIKQAWFSGKRAMGETCQDFFEIGKQFDCVVMNANKPLVANTSVKHLCNTFVYTTDTSHILGTMVSGEWITIKGTHKDYNDISTRFFKTIKELKNRL